jgi:hypothetical protein
MATKIPNIINIMILLFLIYQKKYREAVLVLLPFPDFDRAVALLVSLVFENTHHVIEES